MNEPGSDAIPLILGTRNRKKGEEMMALINPPWDPVPGLERLSIRTLEGYPEAPEVVEDAETFAGNARKKASETALFLGLWVLADDSGLEVDALQGAPGVHSARYAGTHGDDEANNRKLLNALADVPDAARGAAFVCSLALSAPDGTIVLEARAACRGRITRAASGPRGFGYDPLFLIPEYHRTFGELSVLVKQQLSHRSRAFESLRPRLARVIVPA